MRGMVKHIFRLMTCSVLLTAASPAVAKLGGPQSESAVRSEPVLPMRPTASNQPPRLAMDDYARKGSGRLTPQARAHVLAYLTGAALPLSLIHILSDVH